MNSNKDRFQLQDENLSDNYPMETDAYFLGIKNNDGYTDNMNEVYDKLTVKYDKTRSTDCITNKFSDKYSNLMKLEYITNHFHHLIGRSVCSF